MNQQSYLASWQLASKKPRKLTLCQVQVKRRLNTFNRRPIELQNVNLFTRSKTFKPNFTRRKARKLSVTFCNSGFNGRIHFELASSPYTVCKLQEKTWMLEVSGAPSPWENFTKPCPLPPSSTASAPAPPLIILACRRSSKRELRQDFVTQIAPFSKPCCCQ